jgi:Fe-Mn family superoxide dismutase
MKFEVDPLPYSRDALAPVMSQETLEFHYDKHHKGYMTKLEGLLNGTPDAEKSLEEVIKTSSGAVFNNAAQVWNHTFFWNGLKPNGGGAPPKGDVADLLTRDFGGWEKFREEWVKAGMSRFGSGYAWLVLDQGKAKLITTPNAETPLTSSEKPLLTVDVWEHAYYLDHRNKRDTFLEVFCDKLINWDFVAANLQAAK